MAQIPGNWEPQARPEYIKDRMRIEAMRIVDEDLIATTPSKYTIKVPIHHSYSSSLQVNSAEDLKNYVKQQSLRSLFRGEVLGIARTTNEEDEVPSELIPLENVDDNLPPGIYIARSATAVMSDDTMEEVVDEAVGKLRPHLDTLKALEEKILTTTFTHSSLIQSGITISLPNIKLIAEAVLTKDKLHRFLTEELTALVQQTAAGEKEVIAAINHIQASRRIISMVNEETFTEEALLELHRILMDRLVDSGNAGEYRMVGLMGPNFEVIQAHSQVHGLMRALFVSLSIGIREFDHISEFLARIHTEFQSLQPFIAGNDRTGLLLINILSLKHGYPVIFFNPEHRDLFKLACEKAALSNRGLLSRMVLEAYYAALQEYKTAVV